MRLHELKSQIHELDVQDQGIRLNAEELKFILDLVKEEEMTQSELRDRVNDATVDYSRNKNSLRLAAPRMYAMVHGELPLEMEDNAGWFSTIPSTMIKYAESQGYEVMDNLRKAKINAKHRKGKLSKAQATDHMIQFFDNNEQHLDKAAVVKARPQIVKALQDGEHPSIVFDPFFINEQVLQGYYDRIVECKRQHKKLKEGLTHQSFNEIGDMLNDALVKYNAAKRGLGITNKLTDPAERAVHRSRIMGNLNRLRALVRNIEKQF